MSRKPMLTIAMALIIGAWSFVAKLEFVGASGGFTIMADGTVDPATASVQRTGNLYTITDDINGLIWIYRSEITLDGKGHTIVEDVRSFGFNDHVTFKNMTILGGWSIFIRFGDYNTICGNSLLNFINLTGSLRNLISENKFNCSSWAAIAFEESSQNIIFHNNFINGTGVIFGPLDGSSSNVWDDGYPSGGNYWRDYEGADYYSGPYQNLTGSDGIGDTPYIIKGSPNTKNVDRYPLMSPWGSPDTIPPRIHILSPANRTYLDKGLPLNLALTEPTSWIGYSVDHQNNVTISGNTTLFNLPEGEHTVAVYANDTRGNMGWSDTVHFTLHTLPPVIQIVQPENKTYPTSSVPLNFTLSEPTNWISFSLDRKPNVTVYGPTSLALSGLADGSHNVIIYATDTVGHTGASERRYFTIDSRQMPYSTIIDWSLVATAIVVVGGFAGLIGYILGKRKSVRR